MNTKNINESNEINSLLNISKSFDPLLAEREIRAAAQQELARAIIRSIKVGLNNISSVIKDASELRSKYGATNNGAV